GRLVRSDRLAPSAGSVRPYVQPRGSLREGTGRPASCLQLALPLPHAESGLLHRLARVPEGRRLSRWLGTLLGWLAPGIVSRRDQLAGYPGRVPTADIWRLIGDSGGRGGLPRLGVVTGGSALPVRYPRQVLTAAW